MSAFQQALAANTQPQASGSGSSLSIRGSADGPSSRTLGSALRQAGLRPSSPAGMEVDGGRRIKVKRGSVHGSRGPLDQTGRHRPKNPYDKPSPDTTLPGRPVRSRPTPPSGPQHPKPNLNLNARRQPPGMPAYLKGGPVSGDRLAQEKAHSKLAEKLNSQEMKDWMSTKLISEGVMDMSNLGEDAWLKETGIVPPGHQNAPYNAGQVFWRLIDETIQKPRNMPIHTISLARNDFRSLKQLEKLPNSFPHLRALDLSDNPIARFTDLEMLLAMGEKKGKANSGIGGLKSLIELKLNGCTFREEALAKPKGDDVYKHEILRRFPGLLILDGVNLDRIVFPIIRKPVVRRSKEERAELKKKQFTFPMDVQGGYLENDIVKSFVMQFCAKYFPIFDNDRSATLPAYANNATVSISSNTLISRSHLQASVVKPTLSARPRQVGFDAWTSLPGRNFLRTATSIDQRMKTLKSPRDADEFLRFFRDAVPGTKHPLEDSSKWCIDAYVLGGEGVDTRLCAMIQGEFQEMPSGTFRTFSRTFILGDAPQGSNAHNNGWPATILSDTMIVHLYMSTGSFDDNRSLAKYGVTIASPAMINKDELRARMRAITGMNEQYAEMCLDKNGWDFDTALANFYTLKDSIPPDAYK